MSEDEKKDFWAWHLNPYPMKKFRFNEDFTIDVVFADGKAKRFDMKSHLEKIPMQQYLLNDLHLFQHPKELAENCIYWDDVCDLYADWIYEDGVEIEAF